jgi:Flp pilus assembly protein TadD
LHTHLPKLICSSILLLVLGILSFRQSRAYRNEETLWRATIATNPGSAMAHNNLGLLLFRRGSVNESIYYLERATQLDPRNAEAHNNFGDALRIQGRIDDAISQFRQAAELEPGFAMYHANLGSALTEKGRIEEAIAQYDAAIAIAPDDPFVTNNLAWLLATTAETPTPNARRAVDLAERAVRLSKEDPLPMGTLSVAYAAVGRFDDAIAQAEKARDLALRQNKRRVADLCTEMLGFYRAGRPFR